MAMNQSNNSAEPHQRGEESVDTKAPSTPVDQLLVMFAMFATSPRFLFVTGIAFSIALIIEGFVCFTVCSANMRVYTMSFYYILFGLLSMGVELKFEFVKTYLPFFLTFSGKGIWYLFLATIAFGNEWWSVLVAIFLICNGMLNSYVGCTPIPKQLHETNEEIPAQTGKMGMQQNQRQSEEREKSEEAVEVNVELGQLDDDSDDDKDSNGDVEKADGVKVPAEL
eukprot:CAMPEP_0197043542 /NCGR_PEP_ID=MMETSP1384-20130603/19769_1 /TAXON_ID=29189 /ORGANISM="Ammonia sp." /LENGTH=223 /DNA_ID=CAMNT_0042474857 /DNA_START=90 /DNA_END=761 /DNA_ORIENTATION=+